VGFSPAEITLQNWSDTTDLELFAKAAFLVFLVGLLQFYTEYTGSESLHI